MAQITSLQIEHLTVTGFGCFAGEHTWTFGRMTTVTGHNYQGKSTIADAIAYALTGAPFFGGRDLDRLQNEGSPFMRVELTVRTNEGKIHEIRRARQGGKTALSVDGTTTTQERFAERFGSRDLILSLLNPLYFAEVLGGDGRTLVEQYLPSVPHAAVREKLSEHMRGILGDDRLEMPEIYLALNYVELGNAFGTKADSFASFVPSVTRGESALMFRFVGSKLFTGFVELYLDTGLSSGEGGRNATDYCFTLNANGTFFVNNYTGNNTSTSTLVYRLENGGTSAPVITFNVPYEFLGIGRDEIFGVTFGQGGVQNGDVASDWDGWTFDGATGVNGLAFVQPERTWDYIRIGADNQPFWNAENVTLQELDLTSYNLHFGKGVNDDSIHAKLTRDETGITFEFITLGDFSSRSTGTEVILIYIDTGAPAAGWQVDHQYKLVSDGNVYKNLDSDDAGRVDGNAWWAANDAHKLGTFTISRENGVTRITYKVLFTDIGVSADEVFGITLVEGWLTGDNGSNEYGGCLYTYDGGSYVVGDAADTAGYIRIRADGSIVVANSNAAVTASTETME